MSNSLQLHGLQPTRLLCPWDFPLQQLPSKSFILYLAAISLHLVEVLDSWITGNIQLSLNLKKKKKKERDILYLLLYFFYSFEKTLMLGKIEGRRRRG